MRDLMIVTAFVCAASGLALSAVSFFEDRSDSWTNGFCLGCLTAAVVSAVGVAAALVLI